METTKELFIAKYVVGLIDSSAIIKYVDDQLTNGIYLEEYLEILDINPKGWTQISETFERSLKVSGYTIPSLEEAVMQLIEHHMRLIASGNCEPSLQFGKLLSEIERYNYCNKTKDFVGDNIGIHKMYSWYYEDECSVARINEGIFNESKVWLSTYASKHLQSAGEGNVMQRRNP